MLRIGSSMPPKSARQIQSSRSSQPTQFLSVETFLRHSARGIVNSSSLKYYRWKVSTTKCQSKLYVPTSDGLRERSWRCRGANSHPSIDIDLSVSLVWRGKTSAVNFTHNPQHHSCPYSQQVHLFGRPLLHYSSTVFTTTTLKHDPIDIFLF